MKSMIALLIVSLLSLSAFTQDASTEVNEIRSLQEVMDEMGDVFNDLRRKLRAQDLGEETLAATTTLYGLTVESVLVNPNLDHIEDDSEENLASLIDKYKVLTVDMIREAKNLQLAVAGEDLDAAMAAVSALREIRRTSHDIFRPED